MSALALLGGKKAKSKSFPVWPYYDKNEERALQEVLESRVWWRTPGTKTLEFEHAFAKFHGARHGIAVTNGTAALEVTMAGLGITAGDEVVLPDFTFVATASAVLFANALPVLVDVDPETYLHQSRLGGSCYHSKNEGDHCGAHGRASRRSRSAETNRQ